MKLLLDSLINDLNVTADFARAHNLTWQAELFEEHARRLAEEGDIPPTNPVAATLRAIADTLDEAYSTDPDIVEEVEEQLEVCVADLSQQVEAAIRKTGWQESLTTHARPMGESSTGYARAIGE